MHTDATSFTYSIYIEASPERVWQALTDPAYTRRYWRHPSAGGKSFPSDWRKGSTYDLVHEDVGLVVHDPEQVILESDPYRRLAYTWHTFTPEWAERVGLADEAAAAWRAEPRSKVAFDIEEHRRRSRQAHRGARRLRSRTARAAGHFRGLAGRALQPQDPPRDRVAAARRPRWRRRAAVGLTHRRDEPAAIHGANGHFPLARAPDSRIGYSVCYFESGAVHECPPRHSRPAQRGSQVRAAAAPGVRGPHRRGVAAQRRAGLHDAPAARARRAGRVRRLRRGGPAEGLPHHRGGRGRAGRSGSARRPTSPRRRATSW